MAITKTNFLNYTRCKRYVALENLKNDKLTSHMTLEEYLKEELEEQKKELLQMMFEASVDEEDIDLTKKEDKQLVAMMPYYKEVEIEAGKLVQKLFPGKTIYSDDTKLQESFDFIDKGIRYLCFVDIYNENGEEINIIEVKATTTNKYKKIEYGARNKERYPLFIKKDNFFYLSPCLDDDEKVKKNYEEKVAKLKNRFTDEGKYIYDLAVQRYFIEHDFLEHKINRKVNYYLAVLNDEYIYDGYLENGKRVYNTVNGEDIISLFNMNDITKEMQTLVEQDKKRLEEYLLNQDDSPCKVGVFCNLKKNTECIYKDICFKNIPEKNASFNYIRFKYFTDKYGTKYNKYDLVNDGYYKFDDIPYEWITSKNHLIQRDAYDNNKAYVNINKIKAILGELRYPIYHLDFESFPCPMPRFKGEKPYTQSCFEFSLHTEHAPGVCDKEKDNFVFLAKTLGDEREELVKELVNRIDAKKGTMFAQNVSFEKGRIKELAKIFPQYEKELLDISDIGYDLLYIINNNKKIFLELGFTDDADTVNYYHPSQSGSYSIKKTLPLFTDLKYSDLFIKNGVEALVEYSRYNLMSDEERRNVQDNLIEYCKQDTWAMVEILKGLRNLVK